MKIQSKFLVGAVMVGGVIGGLAWATPIIDLAAPVLATGTILANINAYGVANPAAGPFGVELKTIGPSQILVQDVAYSPGGHTGWHSHPGVLTVVLISGTLDWYDGDCKKVSYKAGDAWTEGSQLHYVQSTGTVNSHWMVTYVIPKGSATRIDEAAPSCAAGAGLE